jgi:hypothetical protein
MVKPSSVELYADETWRTVLSVFGVAGSMPVTSAPPVLRMVSRFAVLNDWYLPGATSSVSPGRVLAAAIASRICR